MCESLPHGMIGLKSVEGELLLEKASLVNLSMIKHHKKQTNKTYCGPASLALMCNSINAAYRIKYRLLPPDCPKAEEALIEEMSKGDVTVNEDDIMNCIDEEFLKFPNIDTNGLSLAEVSTLAMHLGFGLNCYYTFDATNEKSVMSESLREDLSNVVQQGDMFLIDNLHEFRTRLVRHIAHENRDRQIQGVIVNYDMTGLEYQGENLGHFSPIAAYNSSADMCLLMDVWPDTVLKWVPVKTLWNAMSKSIDTTSGLPRGFIHVYELM